MDCVSPPKTVSRMDAGFEPPRMGLRRVFGGDTQFMSRCQCMYLKPLFITDMNRKHLAETRPMLIKLGPSVGARHPHPTATDGGSAGFAYVHGWTVVGQCRSKKPAMRHTIHLYYILNLIIFESFVKEKE